MFRIGCHLSVSQGYLAMGQAAVEIGADTFQFFTRSPRGGRAKNIDPKDLAAFLDCTRDNDLAPMVGHAAYTINPCSMDKDLRAFARDTMADDIARIELIPGNLYNFHPGSRGQYDLEVAIDFIVDALNSVLRPEQTTTVLLETMAGKGSEVGSRFEELRAIIDRVELADKIGVCMDTCHLWEAGYDIVEHLDQVLAEFDQVVGLARIQAIHLNDSKNPQGAHKDRHARIGEGHLGLEAIIRIINHPLLRELPFILETPNDLAGYAAEIKLLKQHYQD